MLTLILVRHGETLENGLKIAQGQTDGTLTEKGKAENDTLGKGLQQFSLEQFIPVRWGGTANGRSHSPS
ncbi:MAG: histidine phosphatase family protein [Chitinophagaceae bacterium]|nr:histidine phosphatase family protein [Chitinophagaceae bacterium]